MNASKDFRVLNTKPAPDDSETQYLCTLVAQDGAAYDVECGIKYSKGQQLTVPLINYKPQFNQASAALGEVINRSKLIKEAKELFGE